MVPSLALIFFFFKEILAATSFFLLWKEFCNHLLGLSGCFLLLSSPLHSFAIVNLNIPKVSVFFRNFFFFYVYSLLQLHCHMFGLHIESSQEQLLNVNSMLGIRARRFYLFNLSRNNYSTSKQLLRCMSNYKDVKMFVTYKQFILIAIHLAQSLSKYLWTLLYIPPGLSVIHAPYYWF